MDTRYKLLMDRLAAHYPRIVDFDQIIPLTPNECGIIYAKFPVAVQEAADTESIDCAVIADGYRTCDASPIFAEVRDYFERACRRVVLALLPLHRSVVS